MLLIYSAHIAICVLVILVILFQDGKTGGLTGVADNASQQVFGAKGAGNFLTKLTTGLAIAFMFTSLTLAIFHKSDDGSIADDFQPEVSETENSTLEQPKGGETTTETQAPEVESGTGDVMITDEEGNKKVVPLEKAIDSIDVVPYEEAPKELQEAHQRDLERRREQERQAKEQAEKEKKKQ